MSDSPTFTPHDRRMLDALRGVRFGHFNQRKHFVVQLTTEGVKSERQRWWLTKLVHMHREQVIDKSAVVLAAQWLEHHPDGDQYPADPEPVAPEPPPAAQAPAPEQTSLF